MAEYIEREAFIKTLEKTKKDCERYADKVVCDFAIRMANLMPTTDVQEVVRCGLCKHYKLRGGSKWCVLHMIRMHSDDYCSYGAKMDKE